MVQGQSGTNAGPRMLAGLGQEEVVSDWLTRLKEVNN